MMLLGPVEKFLSIQHSFHKDTLTARVHVIYCWAPYNFTIVTLSISNIKFHHINSLNLDTSANSAYITDPSDGSKWFRSGDVGHLNPATGMLTIVDRRKDLVKLQMGEYVSLSKVESEIKILPLVDSVCVHADPTKTATVALIIPDIVQLNLVKNKVVPKKAALSRSMLALKVLI